MGFAFRCNHCRHEISGMVSALQCTACGRTYRNEKGILIFTDDPVISDDDNGYIGYDGIAANYAAHAYPCEIAEKLHANTAEMISNLIGQGKRVLNLGCGPGFLDVELAMRGHDILSGDISIDMLHILNALLPDGLRCKVIPCRMNAYKIPLSNQSVDVVLSFQMLPFVANPKIVLQEIRRVLKPGGYFITDGDGVQVSSHDEICMEMRIEYSEQLQQRGIEEYQISEYSRHLQETFKGPLTVESPDLRFEFTSTVGAFYAKLSSRFTAFQVAVDENVHREIMRDIYVNVTKKYGEEVLLREVHHVWIHKLNVFV